MYTEHNNHSEALIMLQTGKIFPGRPTPAHGSATRWVPRIRICPRIVVLRDPEGYNTNGALVWDNGWLAGAIPRHGVQHEGTPVLNLKPAVPAPKGLAGRSAGRSGRAERASPIAVSGRYFA